MTASSVRLVGIVVYPIKGARGVARSAATVGDLGLEGDRRWMVVDATGRFLSQRTEPRLAHVSVLPDGALLRIAAPDLPSIAVELEPRAGSAAHVEVWSDRVDALAPSPDADAWFSRFLAYRTRLVYLPQTVRRVVAPPFGVGTERMAFTDDFPFLLASESSLDDLNRRLRNPVPMDRFRPNLIVSGDAAYAEDAWRRIAIGGVAFRVSKRCGRCVVTTTDQRTGERSPEAEPLRTLARYRTIEGQARFAVNLVHEGRGPIAVGDPVRMI